VLQCNGLCVLQCVAVYWIMRVAEMQLLLMQQVRSVLQCVAVCYSELQCVAVYCVVCVTVYCSVRNCVCC